MYNNTFKKDSNGEDIILSSTNEQVMMQWEKSYMEQSIDFLRPEGDVLEIGFGCGYSATQIMKWKPKSYTIIECDPGTIKKIEEWEKGFETPVIIINGTWQEELYKLGIFDKIYFDDFPLELTNDSSVIDILLSNKRLNIFIDILIQNHTRVSSQISFYLSGCNEIILSSDSEPFITKEYKLIDIFIPSNCRYRNIDNKKCLIPLITKTSEYKFQNIDIFK